MSNDTWRRCSSCKTDIPFGATYWVCNVSTCNRARTALYFCSVSCWEAHLPMMRHRESWAVEKTAPTRAEFEREQRSAAEPPSDREQRAASPAPRRVVASERRPDPGGDDVPNDILIVASKLKKYIRAKSGMRTSDTCLEALSTIVRDACNEAIRRAGADGRQTVMDRDFRRY